MVEREPEVVRLIHAAGHELGCHGHTHRPVGRRTPEEFRADLRQCREALRDLSGTAVDAYRAPEFSVTPACRWALDVLVEEGFVFDNSIDPVRHDRSGVLSTPVEPYAIRRPGGTLWELTPPIWPCLSSPRFDLYPLTRHGLQAANSAGRPFVVSLSSWEFDNQRAARTEERLRRLLSDFTFATASKRSPAGTSGPGRPPVAPLPDDSLAALHPGAAAMTPTQLAEAHAPSVTDRRALRVAIVDEELPYPPTSGKRIRTLNLTLRLARRHKLTYLCHRNADAGEAQRAAAFFAENGIETVVVDRAVPPKSGPGFYARLAANLFSPLPYSVASHTSPGLRAALRNHAATHCVDLWHCEWTPYAEALRAVPGRAWWSRITLNRSSGDATTRRNRRRCSAGTSVASGESSSASSGGAGRGGPNNCRQRRGCGTISPRFRRGAGRRCGERGRHRVLSTGGGPAYAGPSPFSRQPRLAAKPGRRYPTAGRHLPGRACRRAGIHAGCGRSQPARLAAPANSGISGHFACTPTCPTFGRTWPAALCWSYRCESAAARG